MPMTVVVFRRGVRGRDKIYAGGCYIFFLLKPYDLAGQADIQTTADDWLTMDIDHGLSNAQKVY